MIIVHHLNNSRSQRVLWLLEELGLEYEIRRYQRDPKTMLAPPSLRAVHPLGKSPVITDGALALHLLAALRGRLGHASAAAEADLRSHRNRADAFLREADRAGHRRTSQKL